LYRSFHIIPIHKPTPFRKSNSWFSEFYFTQIKITTRKPTPSRGTESFYIQNLIPGFLNRIHSNKNSQQTENSDIYWRTVVGGKRTNLLTLNATQSPTATIFSGRCSFFHWKKLNVIISGLIQKYFIHNKLASPTTIV